RLFNLLASHLLLVPNANACIYRVTPQGYVKKPTLLARRRIAGIRVALYSICQHYCRGREERYGDPCNWIVSLASRSRARRRRLDTLWMGARGHQLVDERCDARARVRAVDGDQSARRRGDRSHYR